MEAARKRVGRGTHDTGKACLSPTVAPEGRASNESETRYRADCETQGKKKGGIESRTGMGYKGGRVQKERPKNGDTQEGVRNCGAGPSSGGGA